MFTDILTLEVNPISLINRMFLSLFLHLSILGGSTASLNRMKFAVNHEYMFQTPGLAFLSALLQFIVNFLIDFMTVLVMLTHHTGIGLVANFVVLQVITCFDYFSYNSLGY